MTSPFSRRAPWPYDVLLDAGDGTGPVGLMLIPDQDGLLVGRSQEALGNVAPTEYGYSSQDPVVETAFEFGPVPGGMGQAVQSDGAQTRYRYADGVDCSIGGMPRLGPLFTDETLPGLPAGNSVRQLIAPRPLTSDETVALVDRYAYVRSAGVWASSHDFGVGIRSTQGVLYQGPTGTGGLFVADDGGALTRYAAGVWTGAGLAFPVEHVAVSSGQFYGSDFAGVRVASDDPMNAASWGGYIAVGDQDKAVTWLEAIGDVVYVFKQEGIFTLTTTADGVVANELRPELRASQALTNGRNASAFRDRLWFAYGDGFYSLDAAGTMDPVGPERLLGNDSPVRGRVVSSSPHEPYVLYAGVVNAATGASHLLKYGTWIPPEAGRAESFADAWHGALMTWPAKTITRVDVVQRHPGGVLANPALWVGFADGTVAWATLPSGTADPAQDSACRFQSSGRLYWPRHHADFPATIKSYHAFSAVGPALAPGQWVQQVYRTDPAASYADAGWNWTASGTRVALPVPTTGVTLDTATELHASSSLLTPVLDRVVLFEAIRPHAATPPMSPSLRLTRTFTARAADRVARRDGVPSPVPASKIRAALQAAATNPGAATVTLPDETIRSLEAIGYSEALAPNGRRVGLDHGISVRLSQVSS